MNNDIQLYTRPDTINAIQVLGTIFAKSGMFGCEKIEQGQVLAMESIVTGKSPSVIERTYHIMDGKLSKKALAALAEFRKAGGKHTWLKTGDDGVEASLRLKMDDNDITVNFTMEMAKKAGLVRPNSGWVKNPQNMLRARCISNGVAMLAPEIYAGDSSDDESTALPADQKPLLEPKPATVTVTEAIPVESVVTVAAEVVAETVKPEPLKPVEVTGEKVPGLAASGKLNAATVNEITRIIGKDNEESAFIYLKTMRGWIQDSLLDLSLDRAALIIGSPEKFLEKLKTVAKGAAK